MSPLVLRGRALHHRMLGIGMARGEDAVREFVAGLPPEDRAALRAADEFLAAIEAERAPVVVLPVPERPPVLAPLPKAGKVLAFRRAA